MPDRADVRRSHMAGHRNSGQSKFEHAREVGESGIRLRAAAGGIRNQADPMTAFRLAARKIDDVSEQAADRRTQHVQDVHARGVCHFRFILR
jgi:hypothetical protein